MNKLFTYAFLALAALVAASCAGGLADGPVNELPKVSLSFTGYPDGSIESKTTLNNDFSIRWSTSDHITVFSGTGAGTTFSDVTVSDDGKVATFAGSAQWSPEYYALYPAQTGATLNSDGTITATLPTVQTAVNGTFGNGMNLSVSVSDEDNLYFRNVGAIMGITLPTSWGSYLKIESLNPEVKMSGKAKIKFVDGLPVAEPTAEAVNYVEFTSLSGLSANNVLYFVVFPGNYDAGFKITVHNSGKTAKYIVSKGTPLEIDRNDNILMFPQLPAWGNPGCFQWNAAWEVSSITPSQTSLTGVSLSWECTSAADQTAGYNVYMRDAGATGNGTLVKTISGKANTSCELTGLTQDKTYDFGVQTEGGSFKDSEVVWYEDFKVSADIPVISFTADPIKNFNFIAFSYNVENSAAQYPDHGICFSTDHVPTVEDTKQKGQTFETSGTRTGFQVIPNAILDQGKTYKFRAYIYDHLTSQYYYSDVVEAALDGEPGIIPVTKTDVTPSGISSAIKVYSFTATGGAGQTIKGHYAVADCSSSSDVEFRVLNPGSTKLITTQDDESGCQVLVNGTIFGTNHNLGVVIQNSVQTQTYIEELGIYWGEVDGDYQTITRAIFGVDATGKPSACWVSRPDGSNTYYYNRPIPAMAGTHPYPLASATFPDAPKSWSPKEALSCGPMLVYDGKVMVSSSYSSTYASYYNNYEIWGWKSNNIYASTRARTAVGYMNDGKIVLLVCDEAGGSGGAKLPDVARIMQGLGCVSAMNLDGGGSSAMSVNGSVINNWSSTSRAVRATCGFFKKQ